MEGPLTDFLKSDECMSAVDLKSFLDEELDYFRAPDDDTKPSVVISYVPEIVKELNNPYYSVLSHNLPLGHLIEAGGDCDAVFSLIEALIDTDQKCDQGEVLLYYKGSYKPHSDEIATAIYNRAMEWAGHYQEWIRGVLDNPSSGICGAGAFLNPLRVLAMTHNRLAIVATA